MSTNPTTGRGLEQKKNSLFEAQLVISNPSKFTILNGNVTPAMISASDEKLSAHFKKLSKDAERKFVFTVYK